MSWVGGSGYRVVGVAWAKYVLERSELVWVRGEDTMLSMHMY
jgi:hypothetical protein